MNKNVLIVPMQPTPNGRMHIGHGSGTYLRADVIGRALRVQGYQVKIITGSDAFENWILAESKESGRTPEETCEFFHSAIQDDLKNLDIHFDSWINPRSKEHFKGYLKLHEEILDELKKSGQARLENERIPYSKETGEALMGTWISGKCPQCKEECGGSSCVYCGAHFQPEELIEPCSRLDHSTLEWRTVQNWFARPKDISDILSRIEASGIKEQWMRAVKDYLTIRAGRIRLSGPGTWGIKSSLVPEGFLLSNPYYLYSVYCGEVYKELVDSTHHAFHPNSNVTTIGVFGSDNSTPGLIAPHVLAEGSNGRLKPFDLTVVNGMLFLEGQKCSTSKKHGIWLSEIQEEKTGISSDELRFFLSNAPLDRGLSDIRLDEMVRTINELRRWHTQTLIPELLKLNKKQTISVSYTSKLEKVFMQQKLWLTPQHLDLQAAVKILKSWMFKELYETEEWVLGLTLLGAPFMPKLSKQLWGLLGLKGIPLVEEVKMNQVHQVNSLNPDLLLLRDELSIEQLKPYVHLSAVHS
ncbi:class I tRNA ligase family protein [Fictibacillus nanhaiensis]|uniref:Class I tRNA ligase family protein n=1 Tax=Fictibacillus nanhaiensis TaxID=742169 RepID=A0ABS2ZND0_9BACL|nr:class I tRNA ligase family protein [Fictibacillus nanhaiensis]